MYFNAVSTITVVLRLLGAEAATDRLWPFNCQERFFLIHLQLEGCNIDRMCTLCVIRRRRSVIIDMDKNQLIRLECQYQLSETQGSLSHLGGSMLQINCKSQRPTSCSQLNQLLFVDDFEASRTGIFAA